jgi:competence protein ComEC
MLGATAVVVAVTKALEEGEDAQTHAMILSPVMHGWRVFWVKKETKMELFQRKAIIAILAMGATATAAKAQDKNVLRIYFADVEGGQATLFVTPLHESLLVDTGWPGYDSRDADRILTLCKKAGVTKIDTVLITHFHVDHAGGIPQLAAKVPIGQFIDHGDNTETADAATVSAWKAYQQTLADVHIPRVTAKPGDVLPLKGMKVEIVSGDGDLIDKPLSGGGAGRRNPVCVHSAMRYVENTENDRSLGMIITFGKLRIADLGDLTWAKERLLMCPVDKLGRVDILVVSHHGMDRSSSPALVDALAPRVAIMDNGGHKGGSQPAWSVIEASPRIAGGKGDLWQLHTAEGSDAAHNVADARIANLPGPDAGHSLELLARKDGSLAVTNERTGQTVQYPPK